MSLVRNDPASAQLSAAEAVLAILGERGGCGLNPRQGTAV